VSYGINLFDLRCVGCCRLFAGVISGDHHMCGVILINRGLTTSVVAAAAAASAVDVHGGGGEAVVGVLRGPDLGVGLSRLRICLVKVFAKET